MKTYRVSICLEEGVIIKVKAKNKKEAEEKASDIAEEYGGSSFPKEYDSDHVHRDYFTQDAEEIMDFPKGLMKTIHDFCGD
ncbi:MAG: hypothetical protein CBC24_09420 [Candidatus Pelagibacter sp. TMED64]|nr:MAG: hypothetical protein CBC24_09420 [Candidatus Pelagibacter sp. TMED64]|tara:strand:- start:437 stop:679 length:243 start_codon:yes stop_codon:yes gene_type:complete